MLRLVLSVLLLCQVAFAESPLKPLKLDSPQDTFVSFFEAMKDYKKGVETNDAQLKSRIDVAVRTLNLTEIPALIRSEKGREIAIYLKEVIDRVIVIDYSYIPTDPSLERWRLKDTEIVVAKVTEGDQAGAFLFSKETVARAKEFYEKVKDLKYLKGSTMGAGYRPPFLETMVPDWGHRTALGLPIWKWLGLLVALILGFLVKAIVEFLVILGKGVTKKRGDESLRHRSILAIEKPVGLIAATGFWFVCVQLLQFDGLFLATMIGLLKASLSISFVWAAYNMTDVVSGYLQRLTSKTETTLDDQLVPLVSKALRVFVMVFGVLLIIQNLGFNVMSLLAGLGLGGLAFALAAKDTAANLFGSVMIFMDRPFNVGDWIKTGGAEGTVEEVGFRSTRIRTFYDSVVSIPNSVIANEKIDNMGLRTARRYMTSLGLAYDTPAEKVEAFIEGAKQIIQKMPQAKKDNFHVNFNEYGACSLNILVQVFFVVPVRPSVLVAIQNLNIALLQLAELLKVEYAFPTTTLHIESMPGQPKPTLPAQTNNTLKDEVTQFAQQFPRPGQGGLGIYQNPHIKD